MRERRIEWGAIAFGALVVAVLLTTIRWARVDEMRGDTAIFLQAMHSILRHGVPLSGVLANTQDYLRHDYAHMNPVALAQSPLIAPRGAQSVLAIHAYWVLYPLALLSIVVPPLVLLEAAGAASCVGMLLFAYAALRARGAAVLAALLFCSLVIATPAWSGAALFGQFYPDRLYLAAGLAFMLASARANPSRRWQLVLALLCASINERAAIMSGIFLAAYTLLTWTQSAGRRRFNLLLSAALLLYGGVAAKLAGGAYGDYFPASPAAAAQLYGSPAFLADASMYVSAALPFIVLAAFRPRFLVISVLFMLPNLLGWNGGASQIGWFTHYHSYDLPGLVWAALEGYVVLAAWARTPAKASILASGTALAAALLAFFFPPSFFVELPRESRLYAFSQRAAFHDLARPLALVPAGAEVTTVENAMPFLYERRTLHLFPVGIDRADYAVLDDFGNGRFGGSGAGPQADALLVARMRRDGYDFRRAVEVPGLGLLIVRRV